MDDLIVEFVGETLENLLLLDQALVRFEQSPSDEEILSNIFRMMHTIKGTCGFLGLPRLEKTAHAGEDVLGKFRDGELTPNPASVTLILKCIDRIRTIIEHLSAHGTEGAGDDAELIAELRAVAEQGEAAPTQALSEESVASGGVAISPEGFPVAAEFLAEFEAVTAPKSVPAASSTPLKVVSDKETKIVPAITAAAVENSVAPLVEVAAIDSAKPAVKADGNKEKAPPQTIRVNVEVLENLMTLVSEMVLTRNQLLQLTRSTDDSQFKGPIERLSRTTSELQEGVMKTRMQPIGNAWSKLPRIVRDLSNELGKKINLNMKGEETELDRQVLELIQDPLTHMVRNSADHGLERPDDRIAAGKTEIGTIQLSAFHEGGHIIIEISDDGRGINTERVRAKVLERGLATAEELAAMDDNQVNKFIMRAGFSTAEQVTKVSGRGVGMDVVRSNIEKIGGTIEFHSVYGKGSTFTIKIPLTLAIISSLIVVSGEDRFALPQIAVNEVVRISQRSEHWIESLKGVPILRLRDRLLPLINLGDLFGGEKTGKPWAPGRNTFEGFVVVCRNGSHELGIIVDQIADVEEIVVKPLSGILGSSKYFSGNTILGDGHVILILDINGLSSTLTQEALQSQASDKKKLEASVNLQSVLLFRTTQEGMKAVPLSKVVRIENLDMTTTEIIQGEAVVQYRGRLMPLVSLGGPEGILRSGYQQILVFGDLEKAVGLAIGSIVDIASDEINILKPTSQEGVLGSAIIAGRAADIIDADYFISKVQAYAGLRQIGAAA